MLIQCSQGNNLLGTPASNIDGFLPRDICVSSIQQNSCILNKLNVSPSLMWRARQYSFQKLTEFSLGNNVLDTPAFNTDCMFQNLQVFLHYIQIGYVSLSEWVSHLKMLTDSNYTFHRLTQISKGNNVLDTPASNIDVFFQDILVFLQFKWTLLFWTKWMIHPLEMLSARQYSFQNLTQFS
jgi:hypothetical protein